MSQFLFAWQAALAMTDSEKSIEDDLYIFTSEKRIHF